MRTYKIVATFVCCQLFWSCSLFDSEKLTETNPEYQFWTSDTVLYASLSKDVKAIVDDFNAYDTLSAKDNFSYADCSYEKVSFITKKAHILQKDIMNCLSLGTTLELIYRKDKKDVLLKFIQRYNPQSNKTYQNLIFYKDNVVQSALTRSAIGKDIKVLNNVPLYDYKPSPVERMVESLE